MTHKTCCELHAWASKDQPVYPNWFAYYQANFENHLTHYRGQPDLKFLQLGAYTGDCSVWLMENILTHPTSTLDDVDTWAGSNESAHHSMDFDHVYIYYKIQTEIYPNCRHHRMTTVDYLITQKPESYDFIYVDADHTASAVAADAVLAWRALKPGGILAFDDYLWRERYDRQYLHPRPAIDGFLEAHEGQYEPLVNNAQFWVTKKRGA